jgi:tripartite-type tricarboxylate transporter receptor subunit TctC
MKIALTAAALLACAAAAASAQTWSPQKNVEIIVGSAPGGSNDKTARTVERILVQNKLVPTYRADDFLTGQAFRKQLDSEYASMKAVLVDLGLAKAP